VWFGGSIGNERKKKISWDQVVGEMEGGGLIVPRRKICYTTTKHSPFMKLLYTHPIISISTAIQEGKF
jgi:hypothetical protein